MRFTSLWNFKGRQPLLLTAPVRQSPSHAVIQQRKQAPRLQEIRSSKREDDVKSVQKIAGSYALITLAAHVIKAGEVQPETDAEKLDMLRFVLDAVGDYAEVLMGLSNLSALNSQDPVFHAKRLKRFHGNDQPYLEKILRELFHLAYRDDEFSPAELRMLFSICDSFGLGEAYFHETLCGFILPKIDDPYRWLALSKKAPLTEIKRSYHQEIKRYHPDRFVSEWLPEAAMAVFNARAHAIGAAYQSIMLDQRRYH